MTRRLLAIAALFGVLAVACGKVGPPVRVRSDPAAAVFFSITACSILPSKASSWETRRSCSSSAADCASRMASANFRLLSASTP